MKKEVQRNRRQKGCYVCVRDCDASNKEGRASCDQHFTASGGSQSIFRVDVESQCACVSPLCVREDTHFDERLTALKGKK